MGKAGKDKQRMQRHGETEGRKEKNERKKTKERGMEESREVRKPTMKSDQQGF